MLKTFSPSPVIMRTLEIGGDKNLPYFPIDDDTPFLGWRGLRISLDHPKIFLMQVRAMIEVPSIIYQMDALAKRVDFFPLAAMILLNIYWRLTGIMPGSHLYTTV